MYRTSDLNLMKKCTSFVNSTGLDLNLGLGLGLGLRLRLGFPLFLQCIGWINV